MAEVILSGLVSTLEKAKRQMMESIQTAGEAGQWNHAEWLIQRAKDLDDMIIGLRQNGTSADYPHVRPTGAAAPKSRPERLPYHYIEANKLVKVGPSRDGSTYEHRVVREHFDAVLDKLAEIARKTRTFDTPDLIRRCDVPKHEPLIILAVLKEQNLLINERRGRWVFTNAETFGVDAQRVWSALPRQDTSAIHDRIARSPHAR
jgi:hypothetical protein